MTMMMSLKSKSTSKSKKTTTKQRGSAIGRLTADTPMSWLSGLVVGYFELDRPVEHSYGPASSSLSWCPIQQWLAKHVGP